ncbi:MAG: TolC family protein [bacterium]|nr:TolC family protein [bacterium]
MKANYKITVVFLFLVLSASGYAGAYQDTPHPGDENSVTPGSLAAIALQNNPEIRAIEYKLSSYRKKIPQAGALPDPKIGFTVANAPFTEMDFSLEPMTSKQISVMQRIPFPGINGLKTDIAEENSGVIEQNLFELRLRIVRDVSIAYYDIYFLDRSIEITLRNKKLMDLYNAASRSKYETGKGVQQDILKAQLEYSRIDDSLISLRSRRKILTVRINTLLNRDVKTPIENIQRQEYNGQIPDYEETVQMAFENSPLLGSARTEINRSDLALQLSKKLNFPDLDLGIVYSQRNNRRDFLSAQVSLTLPIWKSRKQDMKIEESVLMKSSAEQKYEDIRNSIEGRISELLLELEESVERTELLEEVIIPQAEQSLNSAFAGYKVDKIDFLSLLNSRRVLFDLETNYYRLVTDSKKLSIELDYFTGRNIKELSEGD